MEEIKTQAAALIGQAPVDDGVKQTLLAKLEKEGVTDDLMVEIQVAVGEAQAKLNRDHKPQLDQLQALDDQEQAEQAQAFAEFQKKMDELEKAADDLTTAVATAQKEQAIAEERKKLDTV